VTTPAVRDTAASGSRMSASSRPNVADCPGSSSRTVGGASVLCRTMPRHRLCSVPFSVVIVFLNLRWRFKPPVSAGAAATILAKAA